MGHFKLMLFVTVYIVMHFEETSSISLLPGPLSIISEEFTIPYYNKDYALVTCNLTNPGQKDANINIDFFINKTLPPNLLMSLSIMREEHGSYSLDGRPPIKQNMCKYMKYDNFLYRSFTKHGNLPTSCPFLEGSHYYIKNYKVPLDNVPSVLQTGKYKFLLELEANNLKLLKFRWIGSVKK